MSHLLPRVSRKTTAMVITTTMEIRQITAMITVEKKIDFMKFLFFSL